MGNCSGRNFGLRRLSPLAKYYGALGIFILALSAPSLIIPIEPRLTSVAIVGSLVTGLTVFVYAMFLVRCPKCRKRLAARRTWYSHGIPGRICPKCGTDLGKPST